jgi:hypothetical protein
VGNSSHIPSNIFPIRLSAAISQYSSATSGRLPPSSVPIQRRIFGQPTGQQAQSFIGKYGMTGKTIFNKYIP